MAYGRGVPHAVSGYITPFRTEIGGPNDKRRCYMKKRLLCLITAGALAVSLTCPASAAVFQDMKGYDWAVQYAEDLAQRGILKGRGPGQFAPAEKITAVEVLACCSRLLQLEEDTKQAIQDRRGAEAEQLLPQTCAWAVPEASVCLETGIITHAELDRLCRTGGINKPITKENLVMLIVRAMRLETAAKELEDLTLPYTDARQVDDSRVCYVRMLSDLGVVNGTDTNEFQPKSSVNRAVIAAALSRAVGKMEELRISVDLPAYSTYDWTGGQIVSAAANSTGGVTLVLSSPVSGEKILPMSPYVPVYSNCVGAGLTDLVPGVYLKAVLDSSHKVSAVYLSGELTKYTGEVSAISREELTIRDDEGGVQSFPMDRCTQVQAGPDTGDLSLIEPAGSYRDATVWVDGLGHTAAVSLTGGLRRTEGIISGVSTAGGTVDVAGFTGTVKTYTLAPKASVSINGLSGTLGSGYAGYYATVLLDNDTNRVTALEVDTAVTYIQGTVRSATTDRQTSRRTITVLPFGSSKSVSHVLTEDAEITYEGEDFSFRDLNADLSVTVRLNRDGQAELVSAWPGEQVTEGEISNVEFGVTTVLTVGLEDGTQAVFRLDTGSLPPMTRNGTPCSIDRLIKGDRISVTVRRNAVTKLDITSQEATHIGSIVSISTDLSGTTLEVKLSTGETASYPVDARAAVTQGEKTVGLSALKPGADAELVISGGKITAVNLSDPLLSSQQRGGTVISLDVSNGTMFIKEKDGALLSVSVPGSARVIDASGKSLSLKSLSAGAQVQVYGNLGNDGVFLATLVILVG